MRIEGNNGGDYLQLTPIGGNLVQLKIAHCCVVEIDHTVPVEFITAVLTCIVLQYGSIQAVIESLEWSKDFTAHLATQVKCAK